MNRLELHKAWLEENIEKRLRYKSYKNPVGKKELEDLQRDLDETMKQIIDSTVLTCQT